MKGFVIVALLALPTLTYSQAIPFEPKGPIASLTASASYIYGEPQYGQNYNNLWGWDVSPEIKVIKQFSMQGDFGNYYMESSVYQGQSRLIMGAGPRYNFVAHSKLTPFIYAEGGEVKVTYKGGTYRDWDPVILVGVGFKYRLSRNLAITVVPGQYLAHNLDWGPWDQNFSTRAGFTYNFFR